MIATRELYLSVINDGRIRKQYYREKDDITVLMNNGYVIRGIIEKIDECFLIISNDEIFQLLMYKDIKKIVDSEWLGGEDIRND